MLSMSTLSHWQALEPAGEILSVSEGSQETF